MRLEIALSSGRKVSLTPLIDVVFILLLFFMLSTKFDQQRAMSVHVPATSDGTSIADKPELLINMSADGLVSLAGHSAVEPRKLPGLEAIVLARREATPVVVVVNDDASLQMVADIMDVLSTVNLPDVSVRGLS